VGLLHLGKPWWIGSSKKRKAGSSVVRKVPRPEPFGTKRKMIEDIIPRDGVSLNLVGVDSKADGEARWVQTDDLDGKVYRCSPQG